MNSEDYIKEATKTESRDFDAIFDRIDSLSTAADLSFPNIIRLIHASFGLNTEQAELQDALKKYIFYGRELDKINLIEELGDIFWYLAIACDTLEVSFEEIMELNIKKLHKRYEKEDGSKDFSETKAINRDLEQERRILTYGPEAD